MSLTVVGSLPKLEGLRRYEVWQARAYGRCLGYVEFCENVHDAAQAAALLLLDRREARQANNDGLYVAHGARHEGMASSEIKFLIKEARQSTPP